MNFIQKFKDDGSLDSLKWMVLMMVVFYIMGYIFAGFKVLFFEQTASGLFAVHNECIKWDEGCVNSCQDAATDDPQNPSSCESCCITYDDRVDPIGHRLKGLGNQYGFLATGIGMLVGLVIADQRRKR